jgi:molybdopterin converting factor small subunit
MRVRVHFWSYFRDIAGAAEAEVDVARGATVAEVLEVAWQRWPELGRLRGSTLVAVDVDYADPGRVLAPGEEVSLFPPVQGG